MQIDPALQVTLYSLAAGLSVFSLGLYFYCVWRQYGAEGLPEEKGGAASSVSFRTLKPFARFFGLFIGSFAARLERRYPDSSLVAHLVSLRVKIQRALVGAGSPEGLTADEFLGLSCFSALAWGGAGVLIWLTLGFSFPILVGLVIGLVHPAHWLKRKLTRRRNQVRRVMPYALDLLTLSVEAGLDFTSALARMAPKLGGSPLAAEFGEVLRSIRLGKPRAEALREMADRLNMGETTSFASSLIQADELGADIGPVLRVLADQMRNDRSNRAEKKAMQAPVKILFPLIAFIFPTVFIIIFAPIAIGYLSRLFGY